MINGHLCYLLLMHGWQLMPPHCPDFRFFFFCGTYIWSLSERTIWCRGNQVKQTTHAHAMCPSNENNIISSSSSTTDTSGQILFFISVIWFYLFASFFVVIIRFRVVELAMATTAMAANSTSSATTAASVVDAKPKRQVSHTHVRTSPGNVAAAAAAVSETTVDLESLPEAHKLQLTQTIYGQHSPGQYIRRPLPSASQAHTENDQEQQPQQHHEVCTVSHFLLRTDRM